MSDDADASENHAIHTARLQEFLDDCRQVCPEATEEELKFYVSARMEQDILDALLCGFEEGWITVRLRPGRHGYVVDDYLITAREGRHDR